jgi:tryptophan halogenase
MTEYQLAQLVTFFPDTRFADARLAAYNSVIKEMYLDARDFVVLHYVLSKRRDTPFWVAATSEEVIPDSLRTRLEFFRESIPVLERLPLPLFKAMSHAQILAGMDYLPTVGTPLLAHIDDAHGERVLQALRREREAALAALPGHYEYLQSLQQAYAERRRSGVHE